MFTYEPVKRLLGRVIRAFTHRGQGEEEQERDLDLDMVLYKFTMVLWPLSVVVLPYLNYLARTRDVMTTTTTMISWETVWFYTVLIYFFVVWGMASLAWAGVSILVNETAPSAEALATVNVRLDRIFPYKLTNTGFTESFPNVHRASARTCPCTSDEPVRVLGERGCVRWGACVGCPSWVW